MEKTALGKPATGKTATGARAAHPRLEWTDDPEAQELISSDPTALMIGFCIDQQITVEQAFLGPLRIVQRLGTIDAQKLIRMNPDKVVAAFRQPPAVHRFPANMAGRVLELCQVIATDYGNDASRIWTEATDGNDLLKRFMSLPGFGEMKARTLVAVVGKHYGVRPKGWDAVAPKWPTLGDVTTADERRAYQAQKRAHKAALRAQQGGGSAPKKPAAARSR